MHRHPARNHRYVPPKQALETFRSKLRGMFIPSALRDCEVRRQVDSTYQFRCTAFSELEFHNENGFTLIEVVVSLLLVGIMAVLAGMFLVTITQGYVFSQQNNETSLKAQVALAKMVKEIGSLGIEPCTTMLTAAAVTAEALTSISYTYTCNGTIINHTIAQNGAQIQFDGIPLVDSVTAFALSYFDNTGAATATLANIRRVDITLSLQGAGGVIKTFADSATILESYF